METESKRRRLESQEAENPEDRQAQSQTSYSTKHWRQWDIEEVGEFLGDNKFDAEVSIFKEQGIDGRALSMIDYEKLKELEIEPMGHRLKLLDLITRETCLSVDKKVFMDPIHGHMELHPLCVAIIDTPQFQRLRHIKQLGGCSYVYPGGSHNRFEHSLGVCHLAGQLVRQIHLRQPELNISEVDILACEVAGLCHDLGHGPFSHMFDLIFMPKARPDHKWQHEQASIEMFRHLVDVNDLKPEFVKYGLHDIDLKFIEEQIYTAEQSERVGRTGDKEFLYEVVANKRNGIDVDKWDYFARDCHHLGITNNFDHIRYMTFARVLKVGKTKQICSRDKEADNIYDMFYTRHRLHRRAYQHKNCKIIETMITDALLKADKHILTKGSQGKMLCISDTIDDMVAYTKMTDTVYHQILSSDRPELEEARHILQEIEQRQLHKFIGQTKIKKDAKFDRERIETAQGEIASSGAVNAVGSPTENGSSTVQLQQDDIVVLAVNLDYGMKGENPIDRMKFYKKSDPTKPIQIRREQVSHMLPDVFQEQHIYVYCKKLDPDSLSAAGKCFQAWCINHKNEVEEPKDNARDEKSGTEGGC